MKRLAALLVAACCLLSCRTAHAHRIDEYLQATLLSLQASRIQASMRLIPGVLVAPSVIAGIDSNEDGKFSADEERAYAQRVLDDLSVTINGNRVRPRLTSWSFPEPERMREGLGEIRIAYTLDLPPYGADRHLILSNHHQSRTSVYLMNVTVPEERGVRILSQRRNQQQSIYELDFQQGGTQGAPRISWSSIKARLAGLAFASLFRLGMRHIAEGTDHLLFLLALLLPAPLLVSRRRWGQPAGVRKSLLHILSIVTAFTIGHSLTLSVAALGLVHVPGRPVEILIAFSIFVSAVHALRPLVAGKEALIAGFFGLIHGLAFAATLDRLGLGGWGRMAGILAFNLGIEAMQILVVAAILPSLLIMSRTPAYGAVRTGGALFACVASLLWITERSLEINTHIDLLANSLAKNAPSLAVIFFLTSVACCLFMGTRDEQVTPSELAHTT